MNLFKDLNNKVIAITGGYGYLGKAMVDILSSYKCKVYVMGRSKNKFLEKFKDNGQVNFQYVDVSDVNSITEAFKSIAEKEKRIDVLINNAYFGATNHPENITSEEWRKGIEGGLNQFFDCIREATPYVKKSNNGKIINVASMYGMVVPDLDVYNGREEFLNPPNYGTAKAGVIHLTKYYAMYLSKYNINVNAISPGPFPSKDVQKDTEFINRLTKKTKLKRIGQPSDLDGIILLLSSNASNYITGQNIAVDGGWTL
ncbi:SDR family oxidoreductase [Mesoflavibacter sp. SCSIO 43206]|uniref:SDR family oxidoreductase n=1 Tax=Mesoflavibacter sp. SCSIO 43206 TaxID=2779362 RepID=UPI001CA9D2BC|nr:SDR family oxidoreductase [Mesoflavibacter sp. SCSIO 43206]UAB76416.1 SDR family oxidoreductase [Mesoflavibacter sp. SCSIO 43206]